MADLASQAENTLGTAAAFAFGFAVGRALEPVGTKIAQDAYAGHPDKALPAEIVAELLAESIDVPGGAPGEAAQTGISSDRLVALYDLALTAPGPGELLTLLRRGAINPGNFTHGLRKAKLEPMWDDALASLKDLRLDPAVIATAIQRGVLPNPDVLPNQPSTAGSNVPPMPQVALDVAVEAAAAGIDLDRLKALTRIVGLPASSDLAARMHFRSIITEGAFNQAILEGNTRGEWAPFLLEGFREILTAGQYAELQLRGFLTETERRANTAKHGMSDADSDLLYDVLGRSIPVHKIVTGLARGGVYGGTGEGIPEEFLSSLQRGNLRPEYYDLEYHNRYTYPSAFVVRQLLKDGTITEADGEQIFLDEGWTPDLAKKVAAAYAVATKQAADPHVTKAENQLWTVTHKAYVDEEADDTIATAALGAVGVATDSIPKVLALWQHEREIVRLALTPSQIKKAFAAAKMTRDQAVTRLEQLGMTAADAGTLLDE